MALLDTLLIIPIVSMVLKFVISRDYGGVKTQGELFRDILKGEFKVLIELIYTNTKKIRRRSYEKNNIYIFNNKFMGLLL